MKIGQDVLKFNAMQIGNEIKNLYSSNFYTHKKNMTTNKYLQTIYLKVQKYVYTALTNSAYQVLRPV